MEYPPKEKRKQNLYAKQKDEGNTPIKELQVSSLVNEESQKDKLRKLLNGS